MKTLIAVFISLTVCACATDNSVSTQRLIEVGESCAAMGKGIQVANWQTPQEDPPRFWRSYEKTELQVVCR